ncbi:MAG: rod shape-determining protein MreD [Bacteroidales bacterium]|nr:rod shape-determining protein MreD [Bacteroidales bacterium]
MNTTLKNILRFVLLVLFQVLIVNNIRLGGYVQPQVYIIFIMLLPLNIPKWQLLLLGFGLGFCIDLFTGTLGLHSFACTLMAFARPTIVKLSSGSQKTENNHEPSLNQEGVAWFLRYTLCMVLVHHFSLFLVESFSFRLLGQVVLRVMLSAPVSIFLIMMILFLFKSEKGKEIS